MKNLPAPSLVNVVVAGFRILACIVVRDVFDHSPMIPTIQERMTGLSIKELCEVADTLHALDGVSHQTMKKMGKAKLIARILADIRPSK